MSLQATNALLRTDLDTIVSTSASAYLTQVHNKAPTSQQGATK